MIYHLCPQCGKKLIKEDPEEEGFHFQDITAPEHGVEIEIRRDGKVIWIHVDGITALRICQIPLIVTTDQRSAGRAYDESERKEVSSGFWDKGPGHLWRPEEKVDGD